MARARPIVLVVEDEPIILMDAMDIVEEAGFTALAAKDADEAIAILESREDIAVIFTDIDMPGSMDGVKLAQAVRNRWPPVKILITSGRPTSNSYLFPESSQFLPKPYFPAGVSRMLRELTA